MTIKMKVPEFLRDELVFFVVPIISNGLGAKRNI